MSPVNMGKEGESSFEGLTGNYLATPKEIAEKLVEGKEDRPSAIRVVFQVKGHDDTLSLFVPLHESAADRLRPFIPSVPDDVPITEAGMRSYLAANMPGDEFLVYTSRGSVRGVTAAPGKQRVRLTGLNKYIIQETGKERVRFFTENKDHETVTFTTPYEGIKKAKIGKSPEEDDIDLDPNPYLMEYLIAFGLDWERLGQELSDAYEKGHLFERLADPGQGFFQDPADLTDELFQATVRHAPNRWCDVVVVDDKKYGIGPKRGSYSHIEFTPVIIEGTAPAVDEFKREIDAFLVEWDVLTQVLLQDGDARMMRGTELTADGKKVAVAVLVPLVRAHPDAVKAKKADGSPAIQVPPTAESWTLDGIVCANYTAERLKKLDQGTLFPMVNLTDPGATGERVLEWAKANVPEWDNLGQGDGLGEVL